MLLSEWLMIALSYTLIVNWVEHMAKGVLLADGV